MPTRLVSRAWKRAWKRCTKVLRRQLRLGNNYCKDLNDCWGFPHSRRFEQRLSSEHESPFTHGEVVELTRVHWSHALRVYDAHHMPWRTPQTRASPDGQVWQLAACCSRGVYVRAAGAERHACELTTPKRTIPFRRAFSAPSEMLQSTSLGRIGRYRVSRAFSIVPRASSRVAAAPLSKQELVSYLSDGCKPKSKWR